jgi:ubiquinone/menaquinone biosynthesis C-methylase UbiE
MSEVRAIYQRRHCTNKTVKSILLKYLTLDAEINWHQDNIPTCQIPEWSSGMRANAAFFGDPKFGKKYFELENSSREFSNRWRAASGNWDDKIVVDIGCGPGNLYAAVGGSPQAIIGVDISHGALEHAIELGYIPLLADAHHLPLIDEFADIVMLNATLHHCDRIAEVLAEAARLVRPGGVLITDEDPLADTRTHTGLSALILRLHKRFPLYWLPWRAALSKSPEEQALRLATEIHNSKPGDGLTPEFYTNILEPLGFTIKLYPHYHNVGAELFQGQPGRLGLKDILVQRLAAPDAPNPPQSIGCIARKLLS